MTNIADRLAQLEAAVSDQEAEIEHLRGELAARPGPATEGSLAAIAGESEPPADRGSTRRSLFKTGALAAGAALAGSTLAPKTVAAADGGDMLIGATTHQGPATRAWSQVPEPS